jgi:hypothetical protein
LANFHPVREEIINNILRRTLTSSLVLKIPKGIFAIVNGESGEIGRGCWVN